MAVQRCHPSLRWSPERPLAERVSFRNFPMVSPKELHFHRKSCKSSEVFFLSQMLNVWYIHLHFAIFIVNVGKCTMHFVSRFSKRDMFDMFQISIWKTLPESWSLSSVLLNHPVFQGRFFFLFLDLMVWFFPSPVDYLFCWKWVFPCKFLVLPFRLPQKKRLGFPHCHISSTTRGQCFLSCLSWVHPNATHRNA